MERLSDVEREELWDRWEAGESQRSISRRLGRPPATVRTQALAILAIMGDGEAVAPGPDGDVVWSVQDGKVSPEGIVHLLIPARRFWDDIEFT